MGFIKSTVFYIIILNTHQDTGNAMTYLNQHMYLFRQYGITEHMKARELDKMISPAEKVFTDAEYPPTMNEMKALEIDIEKLYE